MKQYIRLSLFIIGIATIFACKKDLSTLDLNKIEGVTVDTTGMGVLNVFQFDHLVVKPKLTTNLTDAEVMYEWRINIDPSDTTSQLLATTKDLDAEIRLRPNDFGKYYQLRLIATDRATQLQYISSWNVNVRNSIGEGLVIAETTADGSASDISHIMNSMVTPDYNAESIKRNVYSAINGSTIPGLISQFRYTNIFGVTSLLAITNNSIAKINTIDYTLGGFNEELFSNHDYAFKPEGLYGIQQGDIYMENGKFIFTYLGANRLFGVPFDTKFTVPAKIALNRNSDASIVINFYDEVKGAFVYLPSLNFGDKNMYAYPAGAGVFNAGNLPGRTNLAAGYGVDNEFVHVLKNKTTGKTELYTFKAGETDADWNIIISSPKAFFDLSNAPGINEATHFVIMDNQKVLYYATATMVYAVLFSTATPTYEERYTLPAGETITTLQVYQQSDYPYSETYLPGNNNQLIMSTYGTEGKVYILPLKNLGVGNIDLPAVKTYAGFGKITAIATQK